ncbi:MAG TPA: type VI secretion protein IcmF/TssM N-terminal domain-containing protein [Candidatus Sulfotelmatobacter sp.]|nr:type VI secretion protein IcmF/TssM N-terminal domain-containing protein [Candidatus Sulfotelmatobacter sp.]
MDDDSKQKNILVYGMGALGLGAVVAAITIPKIGIWVALAIILFALIIFGCYFLIQRARKKKKSKDFEGAIESQTAASPRAISDPNRRAALDKLRQKFQKGLQEFKSRGKDIYKLPWYVIIGEPGSGKSEAIRHSGVDFPPGMQDELQGSGGTVNMDWWFTNRSIILDTAGSMIFNETEAGENPEWLEFLRLLRKARPHSPINGLFLVLSVESLIKDSADKIAKKASRLSQRLETIKKTLDVRFPVYLLVTKCDLLTGFREFSDTVSDPILQHQMFGWSNPDPLDTPFKPEFVEQHLKSVADRIKRRRLSLLREESGSSQFGDTQFFTSPFQQSGGASKRRLDSADSLFALPDSMMRLAPRLRRYLETVFVEGEWSAKPVFLRGIYFTSSMREGRALDEAMALATGVPLDQLPGDRDWDKNRSYFMRDMFLEKVFRESGLVTRATNTLALLRKRRLLIMGVTGGALALLLILSGLAYHSLNRSVMKESSLWRIGAINAKNGEWSSPIVLPGTDNPYFFTYEGDAPLPGANGMTEVQYQTRLKDMVEKPLAISWVFKPITWLSSGKDLNRKKAQETIFLNGVLKPLVTGTRNKIMHVDLSPDDPAAVARYREALLSLIQLQADSLASGSGSMKGVNPQDAARYLNSFISYLADSNQVADPDLVAIFQWDYSQSGGHGQWPPSVLLPLNGGNSLASNPAIQKGLDDLNQANQKTQKSISEETAILNNFVDALYDYEQKESEWLAEGQNASMADIEDGGTLNGAKRKVDQYISQLEMETNFTDLPLTNLEAHYSILRNAAEESSSGAFNEIRQSVPPASVTAGLFGDIFSKLAQFRQKAAWTIDESYGEKKSEISTLDRDQLVSLPNLGVAHEVRWSLYTNACALANESIPEKDEILGDHWNRFSGFKASYDSFNAELAKYNGPLKDQVLALCRHIVSQGLVQGVTGMQGKIGFPVFLNDSQDQPMSADDVKALKNIIASMSATLSDPSWTSLLSDSDQQHVTEALNNCKLYNQILPALVNDDGSLAGIKVYFVPSASDTTIVNIFRAVQVAVGDNQSKWTDLSKHMGDAQPLLLDQGLIADGLSISFRRLISAKDTEKTPIQFDNWGLVNLITNGQASRLEDGSGWTVQLALNDGQGNNGNVTFRIVPDRTLPKVQDWPKR